MLRQLIIDARLGSIIKDMMEEKNSYTQDVRIEKWSEKVVNDLISKITKGNVVPIIGYKVFYATQNRIPVQQYIVEELLKQEDLELDEDIDIDAYTDGIMGMTRLERLFERENLSLLKTLEDLYDNEDFYSNIFIEENVLRLLELSHFPLIISTVNFNFINNLLEKYGLKYHLITYQGDQSGNNQDIEVKNEQIVIPTIFNIFGTVGTNANVVIFENDLLLFIRRILDTNSMPKALVQYLYKPQTNSARNILTLGCEIPDWTFRLLLYSLKEPDCDKEKKYHRNTFGGGYVSPFLDCELLDFLLDIKYKLSNDFSCLEHINELLEPHQPPKKDKVFLSLCSEDYKDIGETVRKELSKQFEVWMFSYDGGPDYWKRIRQGISQCRYFMPIVSPSAILKLQEVKDVSHIELDVTGGLICEWAMALENKKKSYADKRYCLPYLYKTEVSRFKDELLKIDSQRQYLWPLFYGDDTTLEAITDGLNVEEVVKRLKQ